MTAPNAAPTIPEHLLPREAYDALLDRMMLAPVGFDHRSCLIEALGEIGNIWPEGVETVEVTIEGAEAAA